MKSMLKDMLRKLKEQKGATAVEYGLMVALIAVVIVGAVSALGSSVMDTFNNVATTIGAAL
jgi:pilus assembly protein Flp/PilA